jgi:hypothetical protein
MVNCVEDTVFEDKVRKNFFKDENERLLWIRLNAQHIQYSSKKVNHIDKPLGELGVRFSYMQISANQLEYDEYMCDAPRYSFEELLTLSDEDMFKLARKRNEEEIRKMFANFK